jgi:hypothetical protein
MKLTRYHNDDVEMTHGIKSSLLPFSTPFAFGYEIKILHCCGDVFSTEK